MPGPPPKDPKLRSRRNKTSTRAKLSAVPTPDKPDLPSGLLGEEEEEWHPMVLDAWAAFWNSPMADEFLEADHHGLFKLARLEQDFWMARSPTARKEAATEIRLQRQCFGLTPLDRRRLQWEVDRGEKADAKTRKRRQKTATKGSKEDPRAVLAV